MPIQVSSQDDLDSQATLTHGPCSIPILHRTEVAVVGAGIAGILAALGAARDGADTILIERFGSVGGHCGPGLGTRHDLWQHPSLARRGLGGVVGEFLTMLEQEGGLKTFQFTGGGDDDYGWEEMPGMPVIERETFAALALRLLAEANVTPLLNSQVTDAVTENDRLCGIVVQNPCGTQAVLAKVVIDCSGNAVVAACCGHGFLPSPNFSSTGTGLLFQVTDVDWEQYHRFRLDALAKPPTAEENKWLEDVFYAKIGTKSISWCRDLLNLIKTAWQSGEYRYVQDVEDLARLYLVPFGIHDSDIAAVQYGPGASVDPANPIHLSKVEAKSRSYIYETVCFFRRHVPGWQRAHIAQIAPFFGSRYSRFIESDFMYANDDIWESRRFPDVVHGLTQLYRNWSSEERPRRVVDLEHGEEGVEYEIPYRLLLPKRIDGLLAAGRHINSKKQSRVRARWITMLTGCIAGIAAAMAVRTGVAPRGIDVSVLQRTLLRQGFYLGNPQRLSELGLSC